MRTAAVIRKRMGKYHVARPWCCRLMLLCVQPGLRGDSYANLSLGNIYFSNLEDRTKYEKHLLHAANFYHEVLKKDDANAFSGTITVLLVGAVARVCVLYVAFVKPKFNLSWRCIPLEACNCEGYR